MFHFFHSWSRKSVVLITSYQVQQQTSVRWTVLVAIHTTGWTVESKTTDEAGPTNSTVSKENVWSLSADVNLISASGCWYDVQPWTSHNLNFNTISEPWNTQRESAISYFNLAWDIIWLPFDGNQNLKGLVSNNDACSLFG